MQFPPLIAHTIPFRAMAGLMQLPKPMWTSNWGQGYLMGNLKWIDTKYFYVLLFAPLTGTNASEIAS